MEKDNEIIEAVDFFFSSAKDDDIYNYRISQPLFQKFGSEFLYYSLIYMINCLRNKLASQPPVFSAIAEKMADQQVVNYGLNLMNIYQSLIIAYDRITDMGGIKYLQLILLSPSDEDIISLTAFNLASQYCIRDSNTSFLETALKNAYGTACQIALAYALDQNGLPYYYDDIKPKIQRYLSAGINTQVVDDQSTMVVWDLICMDIASDGKASVYFEGWKRK